MNYNLKKSIVSVDWVFGILLVSCHGMLCSEITRNSLQKVVTQRNSEAKISLAFVFDSTGSMYNDLVQVRAGAARILNTTIANGDNAVQDYILVPFSDPDVGPAFKTNDSSMFLKALNEIYVRGGKDCPEMSVSAIKQALELSRRGSVVYVFTDAEAKDRRLLPDVIKLIKEKAIRVNFVLTGNCGVEPHQKYDTYGTIATVSSGQIVNLNKSEVNKIWKFVDISINSKRKSIFSGDKLSRGEYTYVVLVHPFIDQIIATVSGEAVEVSIRDDDGYLVYPKDSSVEVLFKFRDIVSVLIRNPKEGNWSFTVRSNIRHTLRVEGISNQWQRIAGGHTVVVIADIDECLNGSHNCKADETCENFPDGFTCVKTCAEGFSKTAQGGCEDTDECSMYPNICAERECVNVRGTYRCLIKCAEGFRRDRNVCIDIDECSENSQLCGKRKCVNTDGSYRCEETRCPKGFKRVQNDICTDIDECSENLLICGDKECVNTNGGYRCKARCPKGFKQTKDNACIDINECLQKSRVCGDRECFNTKGSYRCAAKPCREGFRRDQRGSCTDVNECFRNSQVCGNRECVNTRGSYRCEDKCPNGFTRGGGAFCTDINECLEQPPRCQYECENTAGSFQCLCPRGTRLDPDKLTCARINSCPLHGYGKCQHKCNSETGRCECPDGYRLHWDEISCIDINECLTGKHLCGPRECFNTLGKYHCLNVSCPEGHFLTDDGYCAKECYYQTNQCPGEYATLQHNAISIPCYLPLNTDFLRLHPFIPPTRNIFETPRFCSVYFYPVQSRNDVFGVYQTGQVGRVYNRALFDQPGFHEFQVVSDYLNSYGSIISRTTFHVFVDVSDYPF